jgi:hypothetical protein
LAFWDMIGPAGTRALSSLELSTCAILGYSFALGPSITNRRLQVRPCRAWCYVCHPAQPSTAQQTAPPPRHSVRLVMPSMSH